MKTNTKWNTNAAHKHHLYTFGKLDAEIQFWLTVLVSGSTRASRFNVAGNFALTRFFVFLDYPWAERERLLVVYNAKLIQFSI